jgi:hypothetical protein
MMCQAAIVSRTMKGPHITSQVQGAAFKETLVHRRVRGKMRGGETFASPGGLLKTLR